MPALESYHKDLPYTYAPGLFPTLEALKKRPECVLRVLLGSKAAPSAALDEIGALCQARDIRIEQADRMLARISSKDNCFAAAVTRKTQGALDPARAHLVLHHISDKGNLGTILRTALGFGYEDIAIIKPAADVFDPHVVRASMGALYSLRVAEYDEFEAYRAQFPKHALYPFMLDGAVSTKAAAQSAINPFALVFGNEGSGLPPDFAKMGQAVRIMHGDGIDSLNLSVAAAIGMYAFAGKE